MTFAIKQLDHVVVRVADMDRAIDFYTKVLGCAVERQVDSIRLVQLRAGLSMIDLVAAKEELRDGPGNMDHFAVRIDPFDEEAIRRHLEIHGIDAGKVASRYGAEGQGPSMYILDPDGNTVELKGPPDA